MDSEDFVENEVLMLSMLRKFLDTAKKERERLLIENKLLSEMVKSLRQELLSVKKREPELMQDSKNVKWIWD